MRATSIGPWRRWWRITARTAATSKPDLFGSGTVSGPGPGSYGSLLELAWRGTKPVALPDGETRRFLEDGDEVVFRARARREGCAAIGFGECRGRIEPALAVG